MESEVSISCEEFSIFFNIREVQSGLCCRLVSWRLVYTETVVMAPRQELVSSAVTFLRDPSVSSSPLDKRIEFLKSKNLTQEEINLALSQAESSTISPSQSTTQAYYPPPTQGQYPLHPASPYLSNYNPYGTPYIEPPRRDWRDYFILATVVTSASYGLLFLANRYIKPLIAPPTPPQLEQDKAAIDAEFERVFALLQTLSDDTRYMKTAEEERTKRLDSTMGDIESVLSELKAASSHREEDARRVEAEVKNMRDSLPRAMDAVREANDKQLKELAQELASLKALMGNRLAANGSLPSSASSSYTPPTVPRAPQANYNAYTSQSSRSQPQSQSQSQSQPAQPSTIPSSTTQDFAPGSPQNPTGSNPPATLPSYSLPSSSPSSTSTTIPPNSTTNTNANVNSRPATTNLGYGAGKISIPAWQLAAQKNVDAKGDKGGKDGDGADAVAALAAS